MLGRDSVIALIVALALYPVSVRAASSTKLPYPPTKTEPAIDQLHGVEVVDPYRWLEDANDSAVKAWVEQQNAYTRALLACHPERAESFIGIPGAVPSPLRAPPGCRFAPRCPEARAICGERPPRLVELHAEHRVDCVLYDAPETVGA